MKYVCQLGVLASGGDSVMLSTWSEILHLMYMPLELCVAGTGVLSSETWVVSPSWEYIFLYDPHSRPYDVGVCGFLGMCCGFDDDFQYSQFDSSVSDQLPSVPHATT